MSRFFAATADCPTCATSNSLDFPASVNADRRADLRAAILDGSLYTKPCTQCGQTLIFEPHITYLDVARGQWILGDASDAVADWRSAEATALGVFDMAFGPTAPPAARQIGAGLTPRLVFGWPALVEKLRCRDLGLDDATLELLKVLLLRDGPQRLVDPSRNLRLVGRDNGALLFDWLDPSTGAASQQLTVPAGLYDDVAADQEGFAPLRELLAGEMFVDFDRVLHDPQPVTLQ